MPYHRLIVNMMPAWGVILFLAACFSLFSFITYFTIKRFYPKLLEEEYMSASFRFIAGAVVFLLGFTIALLWQNYQKALGYSLDEASNFYLLLENLKLMAPDIQHQVIPAIKDYFNTLNNQEWPAIRLGLSTSVGWNAYNNLYDLVHNITATGTDSNILSQMIQLLDKITLNRVNRMQTADPIMVLDLFPVILFGACFIIFSITLNAPNRLYNFIFLASTILVASINFGLATLLTYPFSGEYGIKPQALLVGMPQKLEKMERANNIKYYQQIVRQKLAHADNKKTETADKAESAKKAENNHKAKKK